MQRRSHVISATDVSGGHCRAPLCGGRPGPGAPAGGSVRLGCIFRRLPFRNSTRGSGPALSGPETSWSFRRLARAFLWAAGRPTKGSPVLGTETQQNPKELRASPTEISRQIPGRGGKRWDGGATASVCHFPDAITHGSQVTVVSVSEIFQTQSKYYIVILETLCVIIAQMYYFLFPPYYHITSSPEESVP